MPWEYARPFPAHAGIQLHEAPELQVDSDLSLVVFLKSTVGLALQGVAIPEKIDFPF